MKIILQYPITAESGTYSEITVTRPKAKHLLEMERAREKGGDIEGTMALVAACTGLPRHVVDEMDMADFTVVAEVVTGFIQPQPGTSARQ